MINPSVFTICQHKKWDKQEALDRSRKAENKENQMYQKATQNCLMSVCIALPGQQPFGETTYPTEQA